MPLLRLGVLLKVFEGVHAAVRAAWTYFIYFCRDCLSLESMGAVLTKDYILAKDVCFLGGVLYIYL